MPTFESVDHDPFSPEYQTVDHDPFAGADISAARSSNDPAAGQRALLQTLVPGLYDYFTKPRSAPQITPNAAGKVPPADYDPYFGPALQDVVNLGMMGAGAPELGLAARGMSAAESAAPVLAQRQALRSLANMFPQPSVAAGGAAGGAAVVPLSSSAADRTKLASAPAMASVPPANNSGVTAPGLPTATPAGQNMRPTFKPDDLVRMTQLQSDIDALTKRRVAATKDLGPKGAAVQAQAFDNQIAAKQDEITKMRSDMLNAQSAYDLATQPIAIRNPEALAQARAVAMGAGVGTGFLHGLAHKSGMLPWLGSGILGGLEGSAGIIAPNLMDLGQPQGTPAREAAERNLAFVSNPTQPGSWDYARNVIAPEILGGAAAGTIGHGIGHGLASAGGAITQGIRSLFSGGPSLPAPPGAPINMLQNPAGVSPPSSSGPVNMLQRPWPTKPDGSRMWPTDPKEIAALQKKMVQIGDKWQDPQFKHFVPKELWPQ
jgi:hypothetical protein